MPPTSLLFIKVKSVHIQILNEFSSTANHKGKRQALRFCCPTAHLQVVYSKQDFLKFRIFFQHHYFKKKQKTYFGLFSSPCFNQGDKVQRQIKILQELLQCKTEIQLTYLSDGILRSPITTAPTHPSSQHPSLPAFQSIKRKSDRYYAQVFLLLHQNSMNTKPSLCRLPS